MPTGYRVKIKDGITFEQYAMQCARAFGACVDMRDESLDTPIPDRFEPSDYHTKKIAELTKDLDDIQSLDSTTLTNRANDEYEATVQSLNKSITDALELKKTYNDMLSKVRSWVPPTEDHNEFKRFMVEQLEKSIEFDCDVQYRKHELSETRRLTGQQWKDKEAVRLIDELAYHKEQNINEIYRVNARNEWLRQLRNSLTAIKAGLVTRKEITGEKEGY